MRPGAGARYGAQIPAMTQLAARAEKLRIRVGILPTITVRLAPGAWSFLLRVTDEAMGLGSELRDVAVSPVQYAFPGSWRQVIGPVERHFACQFYTE